MFINLAYRLKYSGSDKISRQLVLKFYDFSRLILQVQIEK